jgi:dUTP pyrophosphatase
VTSILIFNARPEHEFKRQTAGASGFDLCANTHVNGVIEPGRRLLVDTGIHLAMPLGVEAQVRGRSGLAYRNGVIAAPGTIDSDYRGSCMVTLMNLGSSEFVVTPGMRIAQLVFAPVYVDNFVDIDRRVYAKPMAWTRFEFVASLSDLPPSERGAGGHGSTGIGGGK